jgi:hypothetical protein
VLDRAAPSAPPAPLITMTRLAVLMERTYPAPLGRAAEAEAEADLVRTRAFPALRWLDDVAPGMTAKDPSEQVDVTLLFDAIPEVGRHRVSLSDGAGAVCWLSAGFVPVTLEFVQGEVLTAHASIAARRGAASNARPSKDWRLRVKRGGTAVLRLGTRDPFRPQDRLEIHVTGAQLDR